MHWRRMAIVAGLVAGCGDGTTTEPPSISGHYSLESAKGKPLPVVLEQRTDHTLEIVAGEITIDRDETFRDLYMMRETNGGVVAVTTVSCDGTWNLSSQLIALYETEAPGCGDSALGEWDHTTGNRITISWSRLYPAVYSR